MEEKSNPNRGLNTSKARRMEGQGRMKPGEPVRNRDDSKTLEVLYDISQAVACARNLTAFYRVVHRSLDKILVVDNFYIALYHPCRDTITFPYYVDEKDENPGEISAFSQTASLTGRVIATKQPGIFYEKAILDLAKSRNQEVIGSLCKVWLGAPLIIRNRVIGAIAIRSFDSEQAYVEKDLDLLATMAQHIALALERKEFETRLRDQQSLLETILESSPVGICLVEDRIFKWVNSQMVSMLGYGEKSELTDMDSALIYPDKESFVAAGQRIDREMGLRGRVDFDTTLVRRDASPFKAHMSITRFGEEDDLDRKIVILADISQLELAHRERMEKEKLQGVLEMAGAVCHEINQPLQTIFGYMELFKDPENITPAALAQVKEQAGRIGDITRQLAKITRYKTKSYPGNTTIMDIWGASG